MPDNTQQQQQQQQLAPTHTPGPWFIKREGCIAERATGDLVATLGYRCRVGSLEEEANAALIAAAPDMLEALRRLVAAPGLCLDDLESEDRAALEQARATIAKAEGR